VGRIEDLHDVVVQNQEHDVPELAFEVDAVSHGQRLGLVPTESSSGGSRSQGGLTKTGNGHARRLLIEAAWHHRQPYRPTSVIIRRRWDLAPAAARARGHAGNQRLHARWETFNARNKKSVVANACSRTRWLTMTATCTLTT